MPNDLFRSMLRAFTEDFLSVWPTLDRSKVGRAVAFYLSPLQGHVTEEYVVAVKAYRAVLFGSNTTETDLALRSLQAAFDVFAIDTTGRFVPDEGLYVDRVLQRMVHTLVLCCWKIQLPAVDASWSEFEERIRSSGNPTLTSEQVEGIRRIIADALGEPVPWEELKGRNGPGAVAERIRGAAKWDFGSTMVRRPINVPSTFYEVNAHQRLYVPSANNNCGRAIQVPKDARGPRFIVSQPLGSVHAEFALARVINSRMHSAFRTHVSLTDQEYHCRFLKNRSYCTIDLKEASDMVSWSLVKMVIPREWVEMLSDTRCRFVETPNGVIEINTFEPMGSPLCFTTMTLIILAALRYLKARYYTVYGDDIIVSARDYQRVVDFLRVLGLVVNTAKSGGPSCCFRESCGQEWLWVNDERVDFKPVYIRKLPTGRHSVFSWLQTASKFAEWGLEEVARTMAAHASEVCPSLARDWIHPKSRYNKAYQKWELRVPVSLPDWKTETIDGWPGLYRWFVAPPQGCDDPDEMPLFVKRWRVGYSWVDLDVGTNDPLRSLLTVDTEGPV